LDGSNQNGGELNLVCSIGIDIGGTKIAAGLVQSSGVMLRKEVVPIPTSGQQSIIQQVYDLIQNLRESAKRDSLEPVAGVGIGTAGQVDYGKGVVRSGTVNIPDWNNVPLRSVLSEKIHLPVWVDNDVNVVAIAEKFIGSARGHRDVVCLALGTGVGGGVVADNRVLRGAFGAAAELGHISIDRHGPNCNCGSRGCLEMYASGPGIARMMVEKLRCHPEQELGPVLFEALQRDERMTSRLVFKCYHSGDSVAREVVHELCDALAIGIVSLIHTFNPTIVVLGGGVMEQGEWLKNLVEERVRQLGMRSLVEAVEIAVAAAGPDAGVIGAALQCFMEA
jgi:glucokinase